MLNLEYITIDGIKGQRGWFKLGQVTLVSGENRSGKTAILAGIQACCRGEVDKVGAASNKLSALAGEAQHGKATLSLSDSYVLDFQVLKGKTASVKRGISANGAPLDVEIAEQTLFGGVPQSPKGLFSKSGEELWSLMLPSGEGKAPDKIVSAYNAMRIDREAVGLKSDNIRVLLDSTDLGVAANEGLKAAKEALSEIQKQIKGCELQLETEVPVYDGPPLSEVEEAIAVSNAALSAHTAAKKGAKETEQEIARCEELLKRQDTANILKVNADNQVLLEKNENAVAELEAILQIPKVESNWHVVHDKKKAFLLAAVDLLDSIDGKGVLAFYESAKQNMLATATEVERWCVEQEKKSAECPRQKAWKDSGLFDESTTPEKALFEYKSAVNRLRSLITEGERSIEARQTTIENTQAKLDALRAKSFDILDDESVQKLLTQIDVYKAHQSQAQQVKLLETRRAQVTEQIEKLKKAEASTENLVTEINAWRREVIDLSIATICAIANDQLKAIGFEGIKIELSQGKRSAATISTVDGVHLSVLSGAEETIYGTALLHAIQCFRGVKCPIIFVEGGELSEHYLEKFLSSYVGKNVNLVVAHYLPIDMEGVQHVRVEEAVAV
jgi:hypothetical protein